MIITSSKVPCLTQDGGEQKPQHQFLVVETFPNKGVCEALVHMWIDGNQITVFGDDVIKAVKAATGKFGDDEL